MSEESTELFQLLESVRDRTEATKKSYKQQYKKLKELVGDKDVAEVSQERIIKLIKDKYTNPNSISSQLNIALLIRRMNKLATEEIEKVRLALRENIKENIKSKNKVLESHLPSYEELHEYLDKLYETGKWEEYIINYLLLNFHVRNHDLLFDIIKTKKSGTDPERNYLWLQPTKVTYIRNAYKTVRTHKPKTNVITDKKFISALRKCLGKDDRCQVVPNEASLGYYIKKATLGGIGEVNYNKIVINLDKLAEISKDRGTNISTLKEFYDIKNQ